MIDEQDQLSRIVKAMRERFQSGITRSLDWRRCRLETLDLLLKNEEPALLAALADDLGKPRLEALTSELLFTRKELRYALKNLKAWTAIHKCSTPLALKPSHASWRWEPLGVSLILGPWNYPVQLLCAPLVACLAAGNCALLKPSEFAPRTAQTLAELMESYFDSADVKVVCGDRETAQTLLADSFAAIFFTGSTSAGREVLMAAAHSLTPVTLELGGKCPAYIHEDANLPVAVRRIVMGKFMNAGQTCVAPDYILAHEKIYEEVLSILSKTIADFYGSDPKQSPDYGRIINTLHFDRLLKLLGDGRVVCGGQHDRDSLYLAPTVLTKIQPEAAIRTDEIFGPILPVITVTDPQGAIEEIRRHTPPLALYLFSNDSLIEKLLASNVQSGAVCRNECILHLGVSELPFGGVGASGMGRYHGIWGFQAFSQARAYFNRSPWPDPNLRYPPDEKKREAIWRWLLGP